ncbi:hypothetical protein [Pseudomonas jilinensis]|nr:hypothetical protein [Pseudomonas jilinensis]
MHNNQPETFADTLQQAALGFLRRHQGEHLQDDQRLFERAVAHLVASFNASQAQAENAVGRALSDLGVAGHVDQQAVLDAAVRFMSQLAVQPSAQLRCTLTAEYVAGLYQLPLGLAQDISAQAYARLHPSTCYLDISRSNGELAMIHDPVRNLTYAVTVASLVRAMIRNRQPHLHLVH